MIRAILLAMSDRRHFGLHLSNPKSQAEADFLRGLV